MPEKRKRQGKDYRAIKKPRASQKEFMSYMAADTEDKSSSDDSDDGGGGSGFTAFDLPNYDNVHDDSPDEAPPKPSSTQSKDEVIVLNDTLDSTPGPSNRRQTKPGGVIFVSDPSQLPNPLALNTSAIKPPVISKTAAPTQRVVSQRQAPRTVPHARPIILSNSQGRQVPSQQRATNASNRSGRSATTTRPVTAARTPPTLAPRPQKFDTHVAVPVSNILANKAQAKMVSPPGGIQRRGAVGRSPPSNALATAAASAVAAGMSATSIMQQVALAAQQAAKGLIPMSSSTPNKPIISTVGTSRQNRPLFSPIPTNGRAAVNGNGNQRNGNVGQATGRQGSRVQNFVQLAQPQGVNGVATQAQADKWKPYSSSLTRIINKQATSTGKKTVPPPGRTQTNLKQMYSTLRQKFSTKQIFDMCLWDMEHTDASLMQIAIDNAFV